MLIRRRSLLGLVAIGVAGCAGPRPVPDDGTATTPDRHLVDTDENPRDR